MSFPGAQSMHAQMMAKMAAQAAGSSSSAPAAPAPAGPPPLVVEPPAVKPPEDAVLVLFGSTNWPKVGKQPGAEAAEAPNLFGPRRFLAGLSSIKLSFIATSGTSGHVVALGAGGEAFSWGRNADGQLGHGDQRTRATPTAIAALNDKKIVAAATGKFHTVFVAADGSVAACGASKQGCVGPAAGKRAEFEPTPLPIPELPPVTAVACGTNFNLALDRDGDVWSWGWSEFGVLGNGTDGQYNKSESSIKLSYEAQAKPQPVLKLKGAKTVQVCCGASHCVTVATDGTCYTWGSGGYGRLGHKDQKDVWVPQPLAEVRAAQVSAGAAHTMCLGYAVLRNGVVCSGQPSLFMWGRVKSASQDPWMYPKPEDELRGWKVHCLGTGATHNVLHADDAVISWGPACLSGELGFGEGGKKSSAKPAKVDSLDGVKVAQVACSIATSFLLVARDSVVDALPEFTPAEFPADAVDDGDEEDAAGAGKGGKRKAAAAPAKGKKGKK